MLTILIISACLIDEPSRCKDYHVTFAEQMTQTQCIMVSPIELQKWSEEHPKWQFKRWKCIQRQSTAYKQDI